MNLKQTQPHIARKLPLSEVVGIVGMSRSSVLRRIAVGAFPKPQPLGPVGITRRVAFDETEIRAWLADPRGWCVEGSGRKDGAQ